MSIKRKGIAASDGIAIARATILYKNQLQVTVQLKVDIVKELQRIDLALQKSIEEIQALYEETCNKLGEAHAQIFSAHLMFLNDPEFIGEIRNRIEHQNENAEFALQEVTVALVQTFEMMDDEYFKQRSVDIQDVSQRMMQHLLGHSVTSIGNFKEPVILVANDLTPSDTIGLDQQFVQAFITNVGGRTSHSAIVARAMRIPAVVGLGEITDQIHQGDLLIVDGFRGEVILQPTEEELHMYTNQQQAYVAKQQALDVFIHEQSMTKDGHMIELAANIATPHEVEGVLQTGAEGIGLFRSEFLYMNRASAPTEEEQFQAYQMVVSVMKGKPVIIRTLDVGGDKEIPYLELPKEENPFLGYRAIRVCLEQTDLFKTQLRAILRASHYGEVKIMFPMISTVTEVKLAKKLLEEAKMELSNEGIPYQSQIEVGIMIEIPASAVASDILAKEVDFFSIGTNDLIQYTLACDRMNQKISHLYQPYHPAVLRLVKMVVDAAHQAGKWVGMCGEMAGDPIAVPILIGMGLDELSMSSGSILSIRKQIREFSFAEFQSIAEEALQQDSQESVRECVLRQR